MAEDNRLSEDDKTMLSFFRAEVECPDHPKFDEHGRRTKWGGCSCMVLLGLRGMRPDLVDDP